MPPFYHNRGEYARNLATERDESGKALGYVTVAPGAISPEVAPLPDGAVADLVECADPSQPVELIEGLD